MYGWYGSTGASRIATVSSVSNGSTVIGPLMSSVPPPGSPADSVSAIGALTGHVKLSACARSFVSTSRAGGLTCSSTKVSVLGASVNRSMRISSKPRARPWITGKRVRRPVGAGVGAPGPGPAGLAGPPGGGLGVKRSIRSMTPRASRRAARSSPSRSTPASVRRRAIRSASLISILKREADRKGSGRPVWRNASRSRTSVPATVAFWISWASLSTSTVRSSPNPPPRGM